MEQNKENLGQLLDKLENATLTSHEFVEAKVNLQNKLRSIIEQPVYVADADTNWLTNFYVKWRQLGLNGVNIRDYIEAMDELRNFIK